MNNELVKVRVTEQSKSNIAFLIIKRTVDIIVGLLGTILLLPISIIIKICLIITKDKGPLFFKQKRVGKDGCEIYIYKFRSMVVGADELL